MNATEIETIYPLSPMQQGMLFHSLYNLDGRDYLGQLSCRLQGDLNIEAFRQAWQLAVDCHPILRSAFAWKTVEKTVQVVFHSAPLQFFVENLAGISAEEQEERIAAYLRSDRQQSFDLSKAPLLRIALFPLAPGEYQFIWTHHHIIIDGWSLGILIEQVMAAYECFNAGLPVHLPAARPFRDYITWLQRQDQTKSEDFWRDYLKGFQAPTPLGIDDPAGMAVHDSTGAKDDQSISWEVERPIRPEISQAVTRLARAHGLTTAVIVQGAWVILLSRYSHEQDVVFGATFSGRSAPLAGIEDMVGNLINTLPVRIQVDPKRSLLPWLREIQARQAELAAYEHCPLVEIQGWSEIPHDLPLFESLYVFENYPINLAAGKGSSLHIASIQSIDRLNFPLALIASAREQVTLKVICDPARISREAANRMLGHLEVLLHAMTAQPEALIAALPLLTPSERYQILEEWNRTSAPYPQNVYAHALFSRQVRRDPQATALEFPGGSYSYQALDARSDLLAGWLQARVTQSEAVIAVLFNRSPDLICAMLGILKTGAAFLPIDPSLPTDRLQFMLEDSGACLVLTETACRQRLPDQVGIPHVCIDREWERIASESATGDQRLAQSPNADKQDHLAYIIYTSGTTGLPKGVLIEHRGLVNLVTCQAPAYQIGPGKRVLQFASPSFDAAVSEIFTTLCSGGTLVLASKETLTSPLDLIKLLRERRIHNVTLPPSLLALLPPDDLPDLEVVVSAGEALPVEVANHWVQGRVLINGYGPTECTVAAAWYIMDKPITGLKRVPIGPPIANTHLYVLDEGLQPVPVGIPGELYIGGEGVARGYHNRPDLTRQRFIADPFHPSSRMYKTGDLVRWLPNGSLDFFGRVDNQIKLRGIRIELEEIESVLNQYPGIAQAVVTVFQQDNSQSLAAYCITTVPAMRPSVESLRAFLKTKLPDYMLPASYTFVDSFPLSAAGKVNRKRLPAPEAIQQEAGDGGYNAPRTTTEQLLAEAWAALLHLPRLSRTTNFFEAGGHSLLAMRVVARVHDIFQIDLPIRALFEQPMLADFAAFIDQILSGNSSVAVEPITAGSMEGEIPLSFQQQRLWFLNQLEPDNFSYNLPATVRLRGRLDLAALRQSLQIVLDRHAALRTNFMDSDGRPVQVIKPHREIELAEIDLSHLPEADREPTALSMALEYNNRLFNLSEDLLMRAVIFCLDEANHILVLTLHHIISDGWSLGILLREVSALYSDPAKNSGLLPPLSIQYPDFARWQRAWLQGEILDRQLDYWKQRLAGLPPMLELPTDHPRPPVQSYRGGSYHFSIDTEMTLRLRKLCNQEKVTLYMLLLAVYQLLLYRYAGQADFAVGTVIANRTRTEIEHLAGFFVNTLVLRGDLSGNPTFHDLLKRTRKMCLEAFSHQDLPFELLVDALATQRNMSHSPLFQVGFDLQAAENHLPAVPGLEIEPMPLHNGTTAYDLLLSITDQGSDLRGSLEYSVELFVPDTIQRMIDHFMNLLEAAVVNPNRPVSHLPMLTADERPLLDEWNASEHEYPRETCAHQLFEAFVRTQPEATALMYDDRQLSYAELDRRASALAARLQDMGIGPGKIVAIYCRRGFPMVTALLGVLKAGAAYLPLDPAYPMNRLAFMLTDSQAALILAEPELINQLPVHNAQVLAVDEKLLEEWADTLRQPVENATPESLAYVIYTSGSTGQPKGTLLRHRGIGNLVTWQQQTFDITPGTRVLQFSSLSFDASVWEIFMALANGGTLVLAPQETLASPPDLVELLEKQGINVVTLPPTMLHAMPSAGLPDLRVIIAAGEACPRELVRAWGPGRRFFNAYGPTETTVCASAVLCSATDPLPPSIGRPIFNTRLYVLDANRELLPPGIPGELWIGGDGVASGYLNQPELTAERFLPDPFSPIPGATMYKTGDRVRWRPDGNLEFLGRIDNQVKLRGFRIELGEIESNILQFPHIQQVAVVVREDIPGQPRLVAYVVADRQNGNCEGGDLRTRLKNALPDYMIPSAFVYLDTLPLLPNGKVNRHQLPAPAQAEAAREWQAPRTATEEALSTICCELLQIQRVSVDDNFFDLGGHSLLATQFVARVRAHFSVSLPLKVLFEHPTIAELALEIDEMTAVAQRSTDHRPSNDVIADLLQLVQESSAEELRAILHTDGDIQEEPKG